MTAVGRRELVPPPTRASELEFIARRVVALLRAEIRPPAQIGYVTPAEAADHLGLSLRTMRDMLARGAIPSYKFEGARRVAVTDLEAYAAARKQDRAA
jgi:excisionase family DNA binding protein